MKKSVEGHFVVDIETAPLELHDRDVIDYLIRKQTRLNNPVFSKIIVAGVKELGREPTQYHGDDEKEILEDFWTRIAAPKKIITFNGYGFDIPFIKVRSRVNRVRPTSRIPTNKYRMEDSSHFDCMLALSHLDTFTWVSLDILCKMQGIPVPEDRISGEKVQHLYRQRDWESIIGHNRGCLDLIENLYRKIAPVQISAHIPV